MIVDFEYQPVLEDYKKNGGMKLGSILKILENSGNKHSDKAGDAILEGSNSGVAWVLTDWMIELIAYPKYGDKILARTWSEPVKQPLVCTRDFEMYCNSQLAVKGTTKWIRLDLTTNRPCKVTEEIIAKYQPGAGITVVDAGRTGIDRRTCGELSLDILPPECDWGTPENIRFMAELYSGGLHDDKRASITVINSNCIWFVFRFAGRSILLTGDTMKRYPDRPDEPYDRMHRLYSDIIGSHVDIVKWVHHGIARDEAAACVHALSPEYIVITTAERETASEKFAADYPDNEYTVVRVGAADELFRIMSDGSVTEDTGVDIFADIRGEG